MSTGTYVLALDGGQSSTGVWLLSTDLAHRLYRCVRGFQYATEVGYSPARETQGQAIISAIEALMTQAACAPESVRAVGTSFMSATPGLTGYLEAAFPHVPICRLSDAEAAYLSTLWRTPGVCLTAGTGSVAVAKNGHQSITVGGWGYLFGDLGGGWSITQRAIQAALAAVDQWGPPTRLAGGLLGFFEESSYRALVSSVYSGKRLRAEIAQAAPLVLALAEQGDEVAHQIALLSACELSGYVRLGAARVGLGNTVSLGYAGGVLKGSEYLRQLVREDLLRKGIHIDREVLGSALAGAALHGLRATGMTITDDLRQGVTEATIRLK